MQITEPLTLDFRRFSRKGFAKKSGGGSNEWQWCWGVKGMVRTLAGATHIGQSNKLHTQKRLCFTLFFQTVFKPTA